MERFSQTAGYPLQGRLQTQQKKKETKLNDAHYIVKFA